MSISISLNGRDYSEQARNTFVYKSKCEKGYFCDPADASRMILAPNGTIANDSSNFTLCHPGSFQPKNGQLNCIPCPVGFYCPDFGLYAPVICPAGHICDEIELISPTKPCPKGHYCNPGTKTDSITSFFSNPGWISNSSTGLVVADPDHMPWNYSKRLYPESGVRRSTHPPSSLSVFAERPFPCPLGFYCRDGVATYIPMPYNFSTPQKCFDGFFCPQGSSTPEGSGPCPTGFYCPSAELAIICPKGHYCSGVGNTEPRECHPGSYCDKEGQSNCELCEIGNICPGWGRIEPLPCPPGFVCSNKGLSIPYIRCPAGYYCEQGTMTSKAFENQIMKAPIECPRGVFCLGGVAHNITVDWLPDTPRGARAPQICTEGYFCGTKSSLPRGDGACFPGHYCPPGSSHPLSVPPGSFTSSAGAIVPTLCFPGTYSPIRGSTVCRVCPAGFSCQEYGTYIPRICNAGYYRSMADSVTCKMCPAGTFNPYRGATDISECIPCPEGRICGIRGMNDLSTSSSCPAGHVCGSGTSRENQFSHQCPAGHFCKEATCSNDQIQNSCPTGAFCPRGTPSQTAVTNICGLGHYCPASTTTSDPLFTRCPQRTSSKSGSDDVYDCNVEAVDVCDKEWISSKNPFEDASFYHQYQYSTVDNSQSIVAFDSSQKQNYSGELSVLRKIIPTDSDTTKLEWINDTVEVFRSCPNYIYSLESQTIVVVGRNFQNSSSLSCRFRNCIKSVYDENGHNEYRDIPGLCHSHLNQPTEHLSTKSISTRGIFISSTRVACPVPESLSSNFNDRSFLDGVTCGIDTSGNYFYLQQCNNRDILLGICDTRGFKRVYSLMLDCSSFEISSGLCNRSPSTTSKFNPCLTSQAIVEVSNNGQIFSGNETFRLDLNPNDLFVKGTYSILTYGRSNILDNLSHLLEGDRILQDMVQLDSKKCLVTFFEEEGERAREKGWFMLPSLHQAHLSFDFRHLPNILKYEEHFKIALYARPSRCAYSSCNIKRKRLPDTEVLPCRLPSKLPKWFIDPSVAKNQVLNVTMMALDDVLIKPEIHILHGIFLSSADFFMQTLSFKVDKPKRASSKYLFTESINIPDEGKRLLSPFVSWSRRQIALDWFYAIKYSELDEERVSQPLNMPPRWKDYERGRLLLSMNTTHENPSPTIMDNSTDISKPFSFWENPFPSSELAKESTDTYFESFHGLQLLDGDRYDYDHKDIILPYLPYFSNCREFDSYIALWALVESENACELPEISTNFNENWWRRDFKPLPHQDEIIPIGPLDIFTFYPVADWCERRIYCQYEENLSKPDVKRRWFEATTGTSLFSIIREPLNYFDFVGRSDSVPSSDDGGGQKWINNIKSTDMFIPVKVNRESATDIEEGCDELCFPRRMTLHVSYFQKDRFTKRIVEASLEFHEYDKDHNRTEYELDVRFYPLDYRELIVKFAYGREMFLLLFAIIGCFTIFATTLFWIVSRMTTRLQNPPKLKLYSRLGLTIPHAIFGFVLGILPVLAVTSFSTFLLKGQSFQSAFQENFIALDTFKSFRRHYMHSTVDPNQSPETLQGRIGLSFAIISIFCILESSFLFVPNKVDRVSKSHIMPNDIISVRALRKWKRSNFLYASFSMGLFLTLIVEWSFWNQFGTYIWEAIIALKMINILIGQLVDHQLNESLLSAPVMTSMGLIQTLVTLSAVDFMDFLLSYIVELGFLILERMYTDPGQSIVIEGLMNLKKRIFEGFLKIISNFGKSLSNVAMDQQEENKEILLEKSETVEPILDSYGSYCCDTMSLLYTPYIILLLMSYRQEMSIPSMYGIKEQDMEYYLLFAVVIIPFQFIADLFIHGSQELYHGWKLYDYLMYARYRFEQRELRWKGLEDNLDECIDESLRSMDQMCFSSQFYMMLTLHVNGIVYFVLGLQMMIRAKYNFFGDPVFLILVPYVGLSTLIVRKISIWIGKFFNVWKTKHENTAWHAGIRSFDNNMINLGTNEFDGANHETYAMDRQITSDPFRHKFLKHNRLWLINQLPNLLTPRTLRRSRPYLIGQFSKILHNLNNDISSDSSSDGEIGKNFREPILTASSRKIIKEWLYQAQRRIKLLKVVEPQVIRARSLQCEQCLSRDQVQVELLVDVDEL